MKGTLIFAVALAVACALPTENQEKNDPEGSGYRNHKLLSMTPTTKQQLEALEQVESGIEGSDFWIDPLLNHQAVFRISPDKFNDVMGILKNAGGHPNVLHEDVQEMMDTPEPQTQSRAATTQYIVNNAQYHSYATIQNYLNTFKSTYPSLVPDVGVTPHKTHDNRDVSYITLSTNGIGSTKQAIFMECGIHAREWISPAVCLYFIDRLLANYNSESTATELLNQFDWVIVPAANPDGYEYTRSSTSNRLWRKNRRRFTTGNCNGYYGVDLNRNFDAMWGTTGVSSSCTADTYPGTGAFSEPESMNIRDKVNEIKDRLSAFISIHSYSQMILTPYGFDGTKPSNTGHITSVSNAARDKLYNVHNKYFTVGTPGELLYHASGGSYDWSIVGAGVSFAVTYELRPAGSDWATGFRLPANQILPSGEEMWESLAHIALNH
ncbi:carboxypeptidase B [Patella vulgata]|uniref:carboxypeptidase B n=1 Tax=Patella vulgata TaxID=6465 RepID=UPI00218043A8|nr:carboxypeptidase B [Patella vulgata]